jgi:hypothetical protein
MPRTIDIFIALSPNLRQFNKTHPAGRSARLGHDVVITERTSGSLSGMNVP